MSTPFPGRQYDSPPKKIGLFPAFSFYRQILNIVVSEGIKAAKTHYTGDDWVIASVRVLRTIESIGGQLHVRGMENIDKSEKPCVFIGNHMSTLETFCLPALIQPRREVTFAVKQNLLEVPFFKHVLISRDPIVVGRKSARNDLTIMLEGGVERLKKGYSIIIFPQSTRNETIDPKHFNSIGIKLARKANVPVVPVALDTRAWGTGRFIKDVGPIRPKLPIHFEFGEPLTIEGNGKSEHHHILQFISERVNSWKQASIALEK